MKGINKILDKAGLYDSLTDPVKKETKFTKVKDNVPLVADKNFMADLLFLPLDSKTGCAYCLVVVDLATNEFDIEPVKTKEPSAVLAGIKDMNKRKFIHIDKNSASIQTEGGGEFLGIFSKWLYDESILHKVTLPNRHTQLANINYLCRQLGALFNSYMNKQERQTGKVFRDWVDYVPEARKLLNETRIRKLPKDIYTYNTPIFDLNAPEPKYAVGNIVLRKLDHPENALGHEVSGAFRTGDYRWSRVPHKIERVLYYSKPINYRYMISGIKNASFTEAQLMPAPENEKQEKYVVEKLIDKRKVSNKIEYLVKWKGYLKAQSTWEPKANLVADGLQSDISDYEESVKKKK